ncbi:MAG: transposase, partial [Patescibacteria group bacterium]
MLQNNKQQLNETLSDPAMLWQLNHTLQQYNDKLRDDNQQLHEQVAALKHQLEWFKRQVFGRTSEKRLIDIPGQGNLLQGLVETHVGQHDVPTEQVTYERKKPNKARHNSVNDSGLRFDETVEVKEIRLSVPELEGPDADQYLVIDEHVTCRLAQRRSSYLVLKYIQPVIKRKDSGL